MFSFQPVASIWLISIALVILTAVLLWLEVTKAVHYKTLRVISALVLTVSLAAILVRPHIRTQSSGFSILVTDNTPATAIDSLKEKFPGADILSHGSGLDNSEKTSSPNHELAEKKIGIVTGNGLNAAALDVLPEKSFNYLPSDLPEGIIDLRLPKEIIAERNCELTGVINNQSDSVNLALSGPGGRIDSVTIAGKGLQPFSLGFVPKQAGNVGYRLSVNGKTETLPVIIHSQRQQKVLVIQMFPTFETNYLKNILASHHRLAFRYQLSKNNFRYEYINHPNIRIDRLTSEVLNRFDLVIIDMDAFAALSPAERKNLENSVKAGLGVLILFTESPKPGTNAQLFLPFTFRQIQKDTAHFHLGKRLTLPAWPVEAKTSAGKIIPIIENKERILTGYAYEGFGKIGFQLLQETYSLALQGDSSSYRNLWLSILHSNARTENRNFEISIANDFPIYESQPVQIEVKGSSKVAPTLVHNGIEVPMAEDLVIDDLWRTKVWAGEPGWYELQIKGDSVKTFYYVSDDSEWRSLATANAIRNTKKVSSDKPVQSHSSWEYKPFATWLFYLMFVISAAALWLTPKV